MQASALAPVETGAQSPGTDKELFAALFRGELEIAQHFQPIVDLHGGVVTGYEALSRFPAVFGAGPDVCLARARKLGVTERVEALLFSRALRARDGLPQNCFLSVNAGPEFLLSDRCRASLEGERDLGGIVIEVTEEVSVADYGELRDRLLLIRRLGGAIAVDDAGAGYASLSHILEIKPEFIKIDKKIVQNCRHDRAKSTLIEMLGAAANRLDGWILAEGVENAGDLEELILLGVPLAQGYFLGRPAPEMLPCSSAAAEIITRVREPGPESQLNGVLAAAPYTQTLEGAYQLLAEGGDPVAVVTDVWGRPVGVAQQHSICGRRQLPTFMKVQIDSEPGAVLQRALLRETGARYDPLVVIGPEGQYLGVIEIDRLMSSLLGSPFRSPRRLT